MGWVMRLVLIAVFEEFIAVDLHSKHTPSPLSPRRGMLGTIWRHPWFLCLRAQWYWCLVGQNQNAAKHL